MSSCGCKQNSFNAFRGNQSRHYFAPDRGHRSTNSIFRQQYLLDSSAFNYKIIGHTTVQTFSNAKAQAKYDLYRFDPVQFRDVLVAASDIPGCQTTWFLYNIGSTATLISAGLTNNGVPIQPAGSVISNPFGDPPLLSVYLSTIEDNRKIRLGVTVQLCDNPNDESSSEAELEITLKPDIATGLGNAPEVIPPCEDVQVNGPSVLRCGESALYSPSNPTLLNGTYYTYSLSNPTWRINYGSKSNSILITAPNFRIASRNQNNSAILCITRHSPNCIPTTSCKLITVDCTVRPYVSDWPVLAAQRNNFTSSHFDIR